MRESRIRSEILTVMIDTMISVMMKMPPIAATSATVALLMYCCAVGSTRGCRNQAAAAAATQATMARTSRVNPRTAARRAEITTTPMTTRSRIETGMRPSLVRGNKGREALIIAVNGVGRIASRSDAVTLRCGAGPVFRAGAFAAMPATRSVIWPMAEAASGRPLPFLRLRGGRDGRARSRASRPP